ncbi:MAG: hypothetical protein IKB41_01730 [Clostridia bacterium]|nr:hypothetical protein [Clostridia bacterium]
MEVVFMIFMTFVSVVALFAVMVVVRDVVKESYITKRINNAAERERDVAMREAILAEKEAEAYLSSRKQEKALEEAPAVSEVPVEEAPAKEVAVAEVVAEPVAEVVSEAEAVQEPEALNDAQEDEEGTVSFSASTSQTLEEKYLELSSEQKRFYDDIIKYAAGKEASRRYYNQRYEEYKIGSKRIVRLRIKRGVVYCEFLLTNSDFRNYISENKIPVKQAATVIKVVDAATVDAVKNSIDIAVQLIEEEKAYKKQLAREKRKQAREQKEV